MSQELELEVAVEVHPEAGEEEGESVGVLNVAVPLTLSMRNSSMEWARDSHVIEATPHSPALGTGLGGPQVENVPTPEHPAQPDQLVFEESPSHEDEVAGREEGAHERDGDSVAPATPAPTPPQAHTVMAPLFQQIPRPIVELPNLAQQALERLAAANPSRQVEDSPDDFRPLKKRRVQEPLPQDTDDEKEGQTCSICFEPWSNSGAHRIASLKCGHIFGQTCIEKWLKGQGVGKCPQCNAKAKKSEVRPIYAKAISVVDTTERDRALEDLKEEKALRIAAQKAEAQAILQHQLAKTECERLKLEIKELRHQLEFYTSNGSGVSVSSKDAGNDTAGDRVGKYVQHRSIAVSQSGGARVLAHNPLTGMLLASKPSGNLLYPGFGLMKVSILEPRYSEYVSLHTGIIRDVAFSPKGDEMVATAGVDRFLKLTNMHSNTTVQCYQTPVPAWACAWNQDDPNYLFCGLQNGSVYVYDIRCTSGHVTELQRRVGPGGGGSCPVTSLSYVPLCRASTLSCSGLLVGTLKGGTFWEKAYSSDTFTQHDLLTLPEGACTCLSFEPVTRHCLASFRPSKRSPVSRHLLCQLHNVPSDKPFSCHIVHQFTGGTTHKLLSRSNLIQKPGCVDDKVLAVFGEEGTKSVHVWDVTTTSKLQQLSLEGSAALDIVPFTQGGVDHLAILTDSKLLTYQWQWG